MQLRQRQKRESSFNANKGPEKTHPSSTANTSTRPQTAPPPKKRMTVDAPVPVAQEQEKQPEPVNEEPMNILLQGIKINSTNHLKKDGKYLC
jgi:hypothetical protein